MTRSSLRRAMRRIYWFLGLLLVISIVSKLADHIPVLAGSGTEKILKDVYEFLRDMSLLIATGGVAYITNIYQRRQAFLDSLKAEWHDIIAAKSALLVYMHNPQPTHDDYIQAFTRLSETIDNMRIVYRNVGETDDLIGLYPYAPLHDMRRALQTLDPRKNAAPSQDERNLVRDAVLQSFYALRERFLEELDLEQPDSPLLIYGGKRLKKSGAAEEAKGLQESERQTHEQHAQANPEIDALLKRLYDKEHATAKPWRQVAGEAKPPKAPSETPA